MTIARIAATGSQPRIYINWRLSFQAGRNFRALAYEQGAVPAVPHVEEGGTLRRKPWSLFMGTRASIVYVVYSYDVPIAWVLAGHDEAVMPTDWYSTTTNRHQQIARDGLIHPQGYWGARPE